jgi:hypothetical protein
MPEIMIGVNIVVSNGPQFAFNRTLSVEAYDRIDVKVPANTSGTEVELQPGGDGRVQFIAVVADAFTEKLSYKINKTDAPPRPLDHPHLFIGKGAVSLFDPVPAKLFLDNGTSGAEAIDINVQILLGRNATTHQ